MVFYKKRYRTGLGRRFWGQAPPQWHTAQRIFIETGSKMHGTRPLKGCLQGCYGACRGGVMQHAGYELPRIHIPRTPVNKLLYLVSHPLIHRRFIAMCCPCGCELYTSRQLKPPSTPPQSAAAPYRREVVGSRLGSDVSHNTRMVGDGQSWQLYPCFTEQAPNSTPRPHLCGWLPGP